MKMHSAISLSLMTGLICFNTSVFAQVDKPINRYDATFGTASAKPNVAAKTPEEDKLVSETIKGLIRQNSIVSKYNVNVSTNQGVVTLEGNVDSGTHANLLAELAESVIGVVSVDTSKLTVKGSQNPLQDALITAKIKGLFVREKLFGEKDIAAITTSVETKDGVVYISGNVDNKEQIDNAIEIIKNSVPEVKRVEYSVKQFTPVGKDKK